MCALSTVDCDKMVLTTDPALQRHSTENSKQIFPGKELRGYSPNSYIHVSVCDLYIPLICLHILLQENRWAERGNIQIAHMNVDIGTEAAQLLFWEHINSNFFAVWYVLPQW